MTTTKHIQQLLATTILLLSLALTTNTLIQQAEAQETHDVTIQDFAFHPQNLTITKGNAVVWNNTDPVLYTLWFVNSTDGSTYLLSDPIGPSTTWEHAFNDIVDLQYYDFERLWITGFLNVTGIHDVAVTNLTTSKDNSAPGETMQINATIQNQGHFAEAFNVSLYYTRLSDPLIGTQEVTLAEGANTTLTFEWTPNMTGRYEILANTTEIPSEIDTADNVRTTIVYVRHASNGNPQSESANGYYAWALIFGVLATVMIVPEFRKNNKRSQHNMPTIILKYTPPNNIIDTLHASFRQKLL